ncbi:glycosyltransferase [Ruegeria atlantica]|uniref:glycosyltransferase n=1 Tax=Ruegeria atlantica TaxID=81569 RepID=UPI00147E1BE0|nr:glycosyltransferase [Ruegeria atlantica]
MFALVTLCALFLLGMLTYHLFLVMRYRSLRGPDPEPASHWPEADLPHVTVQLPIYNEGELAANILAHAAALDYPHDRLEIQLLDDSDDGLTSDNASRKIAELKKSHPDIRFQYFHRADRTGFKAGALRLGTENARGDYLAIFDADFNIPPDYLRRTIHFFRDPAIGAVQARWDYANDNSWFFTRLQANKLDAHQMFEQTARARSGLSAIFHGTAGIWRAQALLDSGGWDCLSEVEDVELTVRAAVKGWRVVYLDHYRLLSELPESVLGFVRQQMRWKRGWTRVVLHYSLFILRAPIPWRVRLDLLQRIQLSWGPICALVMTLGVLPYFMIAERIGMSLPAGMLYITSLTLSLIVRHYETKTLNEDPKLRAVLNLPRGLRFLPLSYLVLNLGMLWPLSQATLEGFRPGQVWEVTPKSTTTKGSAGHFQQQGYGKIPGYVLGSLLLCSLGVLFAVLSMYLLFPLATLFYAMMAAGSGWIGWRLLKDVRVKKEQNQAVEGLEIKSEQHPASYKQSEKENKPHVPRQPAKGRRG